jgi:hypothetical protein
MMQFGLVGFGAGAAAALLFASVTSGTWLSIPLFYLAPLPIMIAGLGWSHWAALAGALIGAFALWLAFGSVFFMAFLAGAGFPAWWLGYLAMLARPAAAAAGPGNGAASRDPALEWYPTGRLVLWAAGLATLIVLVAIPNFGTDAESFRAGLHTALGRMLQLETGPGASTTGTPAAPGVSDPKQLLDFLVMVIPPAAAVLATITHVFNLWIAGRVVKFSGRLTRPWPDLSAITFPAQAAALLVAAVAASFIDGLIGIVAGVLASSLLVAYGVLGLAVLHDVTRGMNGRPFLLGAAYGVIAVFGWPMLVLCLLGLLDAAIDLRARVRRKRGPPTVT